MTKSTIWSLPLWFSRIPTLIAHSLAEHWSGSLGKLKKTEEKNILIIIIKHEPTAAGKATISLYCALIQFKERVPSTKQPLIILSLRWELPWGLWWWSELQPRPIYSSPPTQTRPQRESGQLDARLNRALTAGGGFESMCHPSVFKSLSAAVSNVPGPFWSLISLLRLCCNWEGERARIERAACCIVNTFNDASSLLNH